MRPKDSTARFTLTLSQPNLGSVGASCASVTHPVGKRSVI